jgi:hypothetical protein
VSDTDPCPALSIAVRAYAKRPPRPSFETANEADEDRPLKRVRRRYPSEALIFDTETLGDPAQQLMVGVWRFYRDRASAEPGRTCVEEGLFYPDELPDRDPNGYAILQRHVDTATADVAPGFSTTLLCEPLSWWLEERFYRYGYSHRNRCLVVAYNLPFDLGRIASEWKPATGRYRGGFSLGIWGAFSPRGKWKDAKFHPRLRYKADRPQTHVVLLGQRQERGCRRARLCTTTSSTLRTLAFALTDNNLSLAGAPATCVRRPVGEDRCRLRRDHDRHYAHLRPRGRRAHGACCTGTLSLRCVSTKASICNRQRSTHRRRLVRGTSTPSG